MFVTTVRQTASLALICSVLAACGSAAASPTSAPPASLAVATLAPTAVPTPKPTVLTPVQAAAEHITRNVTHLMSISDPSVILAWIYSENTWVKGEPDLPVLADYSGTVQAAAIILKDGGTQDRINGQALEIIDAARDVPGVTLP